MHAATDVTGFGLANQVIDVAKSSAVAIHLDLGAVPEFKDAEELAADGVATSLTAANRRAADPNLRAETWGRRADLLFDPQTNGGLLAAVPAECAADIVIEQ
ncbi:MAG: hypothetical protein LC799_07645 [Actinobacteria bacterium]|nr:hypothetical protein [Actinomycetota bacterium]